VVVSLSAAQCQAQDDVNEEEAENDEACDVGDLEPAANVTLDGGAAVLMDAQSRCILEVAEDVVRNLKADSRALERCFDTRHERGNCGPFSNGIDLSCALCRRRLAAARINTGQSPNTCLDEQILACVNWAS